MGGVGRVMRKRLGRGGKTGHTGETEFIETIRIKVGGRGETVGAGAVNGSGDIATEGDEEFVYGGELLWSAHVKGDGTGIKVVLSDVVGVCNVVETIHHFCGEDEERGKRGEEYARGS